MGALYRNAGVQSYYSSAQQTSNQQLNDIATIWNTIFSGQNGSHFLQRFASGNPGWWRNILNSHQLTPLQKFQYIFGIAPAQNTPYVRSGLLGDIFSWFSNLFSQQNLNNAELFLRQGEAIANNIANGLNYVSNQPSPYDQAVQQQQSQTVTNTAVSTFRTFWDSWGPFVIGGLIIYLIVKK